MKKLSDDKFFKKTCRLCETGERHTTGRDSDTDSCTYWLENGTDTFPHIKGFVRGNGDDSYGFWLPVFHCPWCGKELQ